MFIDKDHDKDSTHFSCKEALEKDGKNVKCCYCNGCPCLWDPVGVNVSGLDSVRRVDIKSEKSG